METLKFVGSVPTLNDLINAKNIKPTMTIITLGEETINDGDGAVYLVVDSKTYNGRAKMVKSSANPSIGFVKIDFQKSVIKDLDDKISATEANFKTLVENRSM